MNIIISPYSRPLRNNLPNAKNYPYWSQVVKLLKEKDYEITQIGMTGETPIGTDEILFDLPLNTLKEHVLKADCCISVDNFFPHFCANFNKFGIIVIWGKSDPNIFGYPKNINLLKDRGYLRSDQFRWWEDVPYDPSVFVSPEEVVKAVQSSVS